MNQYTTKFPAGHPGTVERPNHCPVYTPDGGVIMCSTPADAARVAELGNAAERAKRMEAAIKLAIDVLDPENPRMVRHTRDHLIVALNPGGAA